MGKRLLIVENNTNNDSKYNYNGRVSTLLYSIGNKTRLEDIIEHYSYEYVDILIISKFKDQLLDIVDFKKLKDKYDVNIGIYEEESTIIYDCDILYETSYSDKLYIDKLDGYHSENVTRYFNSIEVDENKVYKKAITPKGIELQEIEGNYYNTYNNVPSLCPFEEWDMKNHVLVLTKLDADTCTKYVSKHKAKAIHVYNKFVEAVNQLHEMEIDIQDDEEDCINALRNELIDMIDVRVNPCKNIIRDVIRTNISTFNGMRISRHKDLMNMLNNWFDGYKHKAEFCLVHGDPNTDNCMYDEKSDKVYFIDPRGYFGKLKTLGLGLKDYDYAKFLYGMTGYSKFNSADYISAKVDEINNNIDVFVGNSKERGISTLDIDMLTDNIDLKIIVGIIWVKLTSYIINDPIKSVAAYLHGNALLTKYLEEYYKTSK